MRRREFITLLGAAAASWPIAARAQQPPMPVIGLLNPTSPDAFAGRLGGFRQGLKDTGYVEGENVAIEYRWADNQTDRLPALAAELVRRRVAVIVGNTPSAFAAKAATTTIPIVFIVAEDPVRLGLVASLARPGGNLTGVNFFSGELTAKRLELLRELVPTATRVAVLVNPAFTTFVRERPDALFVGLDVFLNNRRAQLVNLASRYTLPAIFSNRDFAEIGGLMSYGSDIKDAFRQVGVYVGRILKGAKS